MNEPLKVFITYSHNDRQQNTELKTRLAVMERKGEIEIWDDNEILPGDEWYKDISTNLAASDILLYLVSATSLASKNCNKELAEALNFNIRVIPIILEDCDWLNHQLSDFQALPDKGKPINEWQPESKGWQDVVNGIRKVVDKMQFQTDSTSGVFEDELLAELAFQQGNVLMMLGQIDSAIEAYSHATDLNPNNAEAYNNRGNTYRDKGDYNRAIDDLNEAIKLDPQFAEAYNNRGAAYCDKGNYDRAIDDFNKAIELKSNYVNAYSNRGVAYRDKGDYNRAIDDLNEAIKLDPQLADPYVNRGTVYHNKGEIDRAIEDFNRGIQREPDFANAYNNRGIAYRDKDEVDRAIEDYDRAIALEPDLGQRL